jgi:hypothetical protein
MGERRERYSRGERGVRSARWRGEDRGVGDTRVDVHQNRVVRPPLQQPRAHLLPQVGLRF